MLNFAIEPKTEFFQKTNASSCDSSLPEKLGESYHRISTANKSANIGCQVDSAFPANVGFRPAYEWIAPASATSVCSSPVEIMNALLSISESQIETSRERADSAVRSVLVSIYELDKNGLGRLAAQEVMLFVEKNIRRNCMTETNRLLELADSSKLSSRSLIGLIRSTSRLKDQLPAWRVAYLHSREQVTRQGKNPDALFIGLPKLDESDASKATR